MICMVVPVWLMYITFKLMFGKWWFMCLLINYCWELCVLGIAYAVGNAFAWSTYVTVHYICHR